MPSVSLSIPSPLSFPSGAGGWRKIHLRREKELRGHLLGAQDAHQQLQPFGDDAQIVFGKTLKPVENQSLRYGGGFRHELPPLYGQRYGNRTPIRQGS